MLTEWCSTCLRTELCTLLYSFFSRTKNQSQSLFLHLLRLLICKSQLLCTRLRSSGAQKLKQSKAKQASKQASKQAPITVSLKDTQKGWKKAQILVTKSLLTGFFLFLILLSNGQTLFVLLYKNGKSPLHQQSRHVNWQCCWKRRKRKQKKNRQEEKYQNREKSHILTNADKRKQKKRRK